MNRSLPGKTWRAAFVLVFLLGTAWTPVGSSIDTRSDPNLSKLSGGALTVEAEFSCTDPLGCLDIGPTDPIHIAYALAISGDAASMGIDSRNGVELAIDDVGGQILGHDIQFDGVDEQCTPEGGEAAGIALSADTTIAAVIGTSCSGAAVEAMPYISAAGMVMVSPSNTRPSLTEPGDPNNWPGYYRTAWNDKVQGQAAADYAYDILGVTYAATVEDGSSYPASLVDAFAAEFIANGGSITGQVTIDPESTDFSTELATIAAGSPQLVYLPIWMPAAGYVLPQGRGTPGLVSALWMGADSLWTEDFPNAAGGDIEGFLLTNNDESQYPDSFFDVYRPAFESTFGHEPGVFSAHAYDAFMIIKAAIEIVAVEDPAGTHHIGRQALRDALSATTGYSGYTGTLTCSATGDCGEPHMAMYQYHWEWFPPWKVWPDVETHNPLFRVRVNTDRVEGWDWSFWSGGYVDVEIRDVANPSIILASMPDVPIYECTWGDPGRGCFDADFSGIYDIQNVELVLVTQGDLTKEHEVQYVVITNVDPGTDVFGGTADPFDEVGTWVCGGGVCSDHLNVTADEYGNWSTDVSSVWDIVPGDTAAAGRFDVDGDLTQFDLQIANPNFSARFPENEVHGYEWTLGEVVELLIDDDEDPGNGYLYGPQYETVVVAPWDPNQTWVKFELGAFELQPGQFVSLTNLVVTKTHWVTDLVVTAVATGLDTVSGTADPGTLVEVGHMYCDVSGCHAYRRVNADEFGNWTVDFAHVGEDPDEQELFDIVPGTANEARQSDADGDTTTVQWRVPDPYIESCPDCDWVQARDWPMGMMVDLTIDGTEGIYTTSATMGPAPWNPDESYAEFDLAGYDVQVGDLITVTDGESEKSLTVSNLEVQDLDVTLDLVSGITTPDLDVEVCINIPDACVSRFVTADPGTGVWSADYSGEYDLVPDDNGWVADYDADGDRTHVDWRVPAPVFLARLTQNRLTNISWPANIELTVVIDNDMEPGNGILFTGACTTDWWGVCDIDIEGYTLARGDYVNVSGGGYVKDTWVADVYVTDVDVINDTVSGTAGPGIDQVTARIWSSPDMISRWEDVSDGYWSADFSVPGDDPENEAEIWDLVPGDDGVVRVNDGDGDATTEYWYVPNPRVVINVNENVAEGHDWDFGDTVTLEIDDPATPADPDYSDSGVVTDWEGNPLSSYIAFDTGGVYDIKSGDEVSLTDGLLTKYHVVSSVAITNIDAFMDMVTGTAEPGSEVQVWARDEGGGGADDVRYETADPSGDWMTDFADPSQPTWDIHPGTWVSAIQWDTDSDGTWYSERVYDPRLNARTNNEHVEAQDWPWMATLLLEIDDPGTIDDPDYTDSALVDAYADWDPTITYIDFSFGGVYDLKPGDEVSLTDGTTTKTHTVTSLAFTDIDPNTNIVSGEAAPFSHVGVWACDSGDCYNREEEADEFGLWWSDFDVPGPGQETYDIQLGTWVDSGQWDDDGDATMWGENVPNPYTESRTNEDSVSAYDWPYGTEVTLLINDDPGTPETDPDYTATATVGDDPWDPSRTAAYFYFGDVYDLVPLDVVEVTDGIIAKEHTVTSLAITDIDRSRILSAVRLSLSVISMSGLAMAAGIAITGRKMRMSSACGGAILM